MIDAIDSNNKPQTPDIRLSTGQMQRRAWAVLGIAFALFCALCASLTFGAYFFVYESGYPILGELTVSRGGVGLVGEDFSERFAFDSQRVNRGDTVLTDPYDPQSQSTLAFRGIDDEVFASITLKNASELQLLRARQPRFEWSQNGYEVIMAGVQGEFDVLISPLTDRRVNMIFVLPNETTVTMDTPGHYTLQLSAEAVRLVTNSGEAQLRPKDLSQSRPIVNGQVGIYEYERAALRVADGYENLIENAFFAQSVVGSGAGNLVEMPMINGWNCSQRDNDTIGPEGSYDWETFQGRTAVRLHRYGTDSPGKTECIQFSGVAAQVGQPVTDYDYLSVRTTFYIEHQSLSVCGLQASECPLMLLIDYIDMNGDVHKYYHGFYYKDDPNNDLPLRCNSPGCQEYEQVNEDKWYTYESGNLFTLLPGVSENPNKRPASILNVRFYGSGHEYDVYVSEFALLASPPTGASVSARRPAPSPAANANLAPQ